MKPLRYLFIFILLISAELHAQFTEVSAEEQVFILQEGCLWGNGASFYDYNHDGWDDLTTADGSDFIRFFENTGDGHFAVSSINLNFAFSGQIVGVLWIDLENDGDEDLLVSQNTGRLLLFVNDGNFNFTESGIAAGLPSESYFYYGMSAADYDNDGFIDFTIAKYYNPFTHPALEYTSRLYRNNGDGTFSDVSITSGIIIQPRTCFIQVFLDYNNDGWQDIFSVIDRASWSNELFKNNGDGTFTNVTSTSGLGYFIDAMSATMGDVDRDGDLDIFVANTNGGNKFFINNGDETFTEISESSGLALYTICWGANWIDYDNNGWDDIFIPTAIGAQYTIAQNQFYINNADNTFTEANALTGIDGDIDPTFCNVIGDMNNDGYYDYYNNNNDPKPCRLWKNQGGENNYITIDLEGTISNRNAIGSRINLYTADYMQMKQVHAGESYISQNSKKKIFGLGEQQAIDSLEIFWPSGLREVYYALPINQIHHLVEGESFLVDNFITAPDQSICPDQQLELDAGTALSWQWSTGEQTRFITVSEPGVYSCIKGFDLGFQSPIDYFEVGSQTPPQASVDYQNPQCFGDSNGYILLQIDYEEETIVTWNNGDQGEILGSLPAGIYSFVITSESGCTSEMEISLSEPNEIEAQFQTHDALCNDSATGSIEILDMNGGVGELTWNVDMTYNQLTAGTHQLLVSDEVGCSTPYQFEIFEPLPLLLEASTSPSIDDQLGTIDFTFSGGTEPYSIHLNGNPMEMVSPYMVESGNYFIEITDSNECSFGLDVVVEQILDVEEIGTTIYAFPNPTNSWIYFDSYYDLSVKNAIGKTILEFTNVKEIDASALAPGVYFFCLNNSKTIKVIKD